MITTPVASLIPDQPQPETLVVTDMSLAFGGVQALHHVSFTLSRGDILAIIGPNGAGKTSLLNCLAGAYRPQQGTALLHGEELLSQRPYQRVQRGLSRTFQNLGLVPRLSVLDNLMLGRHARLTGGFTGNSLSLPRSRRSEREARTWCRDLAAFLGLTTVMSAPVAALPYGLQKRVDLGRALASDPTLLLLDEPVAGMAPAERRDVAELIQRICTGTGRQLSVILVEHDVPLVMQLAQTVVVLDFGEVIAAGSPDAVQQDPHVIRAYLGGDLSATGSVSGRT